jgi:cation transport protein ChaC
MPDRPVSLPESPGAPLRPLSDDARQRSLADTLAVGPGAGPVWLFAYGSLMWSPCFGFDAQTTAMLEGYRRAFNFWSVLARGTPEAPGLGLGLESGGACRGILYRLSENSRDADLTAIWAREMFSNVYAPRWLPVTTPDGAGTALCFVTNPAHDFYTGAIDNDTAARLIARAAGTKGRCRDYLAETVATLARHGLADPDLDALLALVDARLSAAAADRS